MFQPSELDEGSLMMAQPDGLKVELKPHQQTVLKAATDLELNRSHKIKFGRKTYTVHSNIGILCDKVGSGKTLEILSIIQYNKSLSIYNNNNNTQTITRELCVSVDYGISITFIPTNIIVVPHTIFKQWTSTISQFTSLTTLGIYNAKTLAIFETDIEKGLGNDIILVSSTQYRKFYDIYELYERTYEGEKCSKLVLSRVVFDEANMINIKKIYKIEASFYWFMSSSVNALNYPYGKAFYQRDDGLLYPLDPLHGHAEWIDSAKQVYIEGIKNTGYIRDTFGAIRRHTSSYQQRYIENYIDKYNHIIYIKNKDSFIEKSFILDPPTIMDIILENPVIYNMLSNIVNKNIIDMINAGDINSAIESFNCNKTTNDSLITSVTESLEHELHNLNLEKNMKESMFYSNEEHKAKSLEKIEANIKQIKHKIKTLTDRVTHNEMCSVCYDSIKNKTILNCCHNSFCFMCITTWLSQSNKCPHCRHAVTNSNMTVVTENEKKQTEKYIPTKLDKLKEIIIKRKAENPGTKFLIFSEYSSIFLKVSCLLEELNINFREVKGNINKTIHNYKHGDINCLLLNTQYFGSGLNLENTDDIIILHSLNKELNNQVIGRAQRPGRKNVLNIWNLKYRNEV
jgi:hypothetical protein